MGTSQLGGAVYGNPNLNQNADIILNEVGSTNRSVLNGALEVILKPVIAPSLIRDCPLTIVSLEVLIKLQPLQSKPLGLAITTAAFLHNRQRR
jgi:hypothetical protein